MQNEERLERTGNREIDEKRVTIALKRRHSAHAIDVSLHDMSAKSIVGAERTLQIDTSSLLPVANGGPFEGGGDGSCFEPAVAELADGQTGAVDGDALSCREIVERRANV